MNNRPDEGSSLIMSLLGETVSDGSRRGASPASDGGRMLAATPHLLVTGGIALTGLAAVSLRDTGGRFMVGLLLALLVIVVLRVMAFVLKGMASGEPRYHAAQASWWYVAMALVLGVMGLVATGLGAAAFFIGALIVAVPSAVATWRVFSGQGHRYPFVADRMETGNRAS